MSSALVALLALRARGEVVTLKKNDGTTLPAVAAFRSVDVTQVNGVTVLRDDRVIEVAALGSDAIAIPAPAPGWALVEGPAQTPIAAVQSRRVSGSVVSYQVLVRGVPVG